MKPDMLEDWVNKEIHLYVPSIVPTGLFVTCDVRICLVLVMVVIRNSRLVELFVLHLLCAKFEAILEFSHVVRRGDKSFTLLIHTLRIRSGCGNRNTLNL